MAPSTRSLSTAVNPLARCVVGVAKLRQNVRRRLWKRGAKELDTFTPRDFLAGAAGEDFGQYSSEIPIFDYLFSEKSINAVGTVSAALGESYLQSLKNTLLKTMVFQEQALLINHLRVRDKEFVREQAEHFRSYVSLFTRDKPEVPTAHVLETQMSQACMRSYLMLLRLRRYDQARDFVEFAAIQLAAVMILSDKNQI
jgi:hypothetical protein